MTRTRWVTPQSNTPLPAICEEEDAEPIKLPLNSKNGMVKAHKQCTRYVFEALLVPALCDSFIVHLFNHNRVQVLYYSHTLMLTLTVINLKKEEQVKRFIALLVAHHHLMMRKHGILPVLNQAKC